jgi:ketosteroid isomerase-like protein
MEFSAQDVVDVTSANEKFYVAFQSLTMELMEGVWLKEDYVKCVHPGWNLLTGYRSVMESWSTIFQNTDEIQFTLSDVEVAVRGNLAWVVLAENLQSRVRGGRRTQGTILATNLFEKREGAWYLVHHHASMAAFVQEPPGPRTLH